MTEMIHSSETSILRRATWYNIPEDGIFHFQVPQSYDYERSNCSKLLQTINTPNFNHISEKLHSGNFKVGFCKCKHFLAEISNYNIFGAVAQKNLHAFQMLIL
jgi:hypothetical protein